MLKNVWDFIQDEVLGMKWLNRLIGSGLMRQVLEIRKCSEMMDIEAAVDSALDNMPDDSELKGLLVANKAEVKQMCITEYNEAETMEQFKDEGRAETIFSCVYENDFTEQRGAQKLNLSMDQFWEKYNYWLKMNKN